MNPIPQQLHNCHAWIEVFTRLGTEGVPSLETLEQIATAFDGEGKVELHQDYWDASEQFYVRLPLIGWLLRAIRSRASAS